MLLRAATTYAPSSGWATVAPSSVTPVRRSPTSSTSPFQCCPAPTPLAALAVKAALAALPQPALAAATLAVKAVLAVKAAAQRMAVKPALAGRAAAPVPADRVARLARVGP